jgi:hypothetical protein
MLSPKLREFLDHNASAAQLLDNVLSEAFTNRSLQLYYVYSPSQPLACHYYTETNGVVIAIREDQQILDEFLCLVYESLNSENEADFQELFHRAELGTISKEDFAHEILRVEFKSAKQAKTLISKLKLPKKETSKSYYYKRFIGCPDSFEEFLASIKKDSTNGQDAIKDYEMKYDLLRKHELQ